MKKLVTLSILSFASVAFGAVSCTTQTQGVLGADVTIGAGVGATASGCLSTTSGLIPGDTVNSPWNGTNNVVANWSVTRQAGGFFAYNYVLNVSEKSISHFI